jgi:gamma-glutamyltranspeptidase/glutathione hydrolase
MWFALTVTKPDLVGVAGEVPILLYLADEEDVIAVNGQGPAPAAVSVDWFKSKDYGLIPEDGFTPATIPASFDAWIIALDEYGTFSLEEVMEPAIRLAEGYPIQATMVRSIERSAERFREEWPSTAEIYLPGGRAPEVGQVFSNPDLARTLRRLGEEERRERRWGRSAGLDAARDYFYRGPIAEAIVEFTGSFRCRDVEGKEEHGLITLEDMEAYSARFEEPIRANYRGYEVYKCNTWTQGAVLLQQLNLLEGYDLRGMGHNSVDYLHTWIECAKLAYADREQHYGDPDFAEVPLTWLLSKGYAESRRKLIDPDRASMELRPGGADPIRLEPTNKKGVFEGDTVHLEVVDGVGNMISATPSGAWIRTSPVVPGLGFPIGTRAQQFNLSPGHPNCIAPGKKPRSTLTPSLVMRDGRPYMVFGTPGGDGQDQWTTQFFLNYVDFGMDVQLALDKPTVHINHFPGSFWPHNVSPGEVRVEGGIPAEVAEGLRRRGHKVVLDEPWTHGRCLAIRFDPETGVMYGGASPRTGDSYAIGW